MNALPCQRYTLDRLNAPMGVSLTGFANFSFPAHHLGVSGARSRTLPGQRKIGGKLKQFLEATNATSKVADADDDTVVRDCLMAVRVDSANPVDPPWLAMAQIASSLSCMYV